MHQDYSEEDFDPDDQLRGKDVGVRSPTQDVNPSGQEAKDKKNVP